MINANGAPDSGIGEVVGVPVEVAMGEVGGVGEVAVDVGFVPPLPQLAINKRKTRARYFI